MRAAARLDWRIQRRENVLARRDALLDRAEGPDQFLERLRDAAQSDEEGDQSAHLHAAGVHLAKTEHQDERGPDGGQHLHDGIR